MSSILTCLRIGHNSVQKDDQESVAYDVNSHIHETGPKTGNRFSLLAWLPVSDEQPVTNVTRPGAPATLS